MKYWSSFGAMLKQQLLVLTRYPANLTANFVLVLVMVVVVTVLVTMFAPPEMGDRFKGITLYGFVIYLFFSHTIWTVGLGLQREKAEGTLTGLYLTPASRFLTLLARAVAPLGWTTLAGGLGLLLVQTITGPLVLHNPWLALVILIFTVSGLIGLGFAIAGLALRLGESIELLANLFEFGLMGLCAFFFPFAVLPAWLQAISRLIPLSYSVDSLRAVALGQSQPELLPLAIELIIVAAVGVLGPLVGYGVYLISERRARQQGDF
jgi:ABC-type multidrug transport system permease subunit